MVSAELAELVRLIHQERYDVEYIKWHVTDKGGRFEQVCIVRLRKKEDTVTLTSSTPDFCEYVHHLQHLGDSAGKIRIRRIRDLNRYWSDVEYLVDEDKSKVHKAIGDLRTGKFKFNYDFDRLLDEILLKNAPTSNRYLPLKRDYYYIFAMYLLRSEGTVKSQATIIAKDAMAKAYVDAANEITIAFRPSSNAIENYRFYKKWAAFDFNRIVSRIASQSDVVNDAVAELVRRGKVSGPIAIDRFLTIYKKITELISPFLNLIRVGMQLKDGVANPKPILPLGQNIALLRAHSTYGPLFHCLDADLRHADAHVSAEVVDNDVVLYDCRGKTAKELKRYTLEEVGKMTQTLQQTLFPAMAITMIMQEVAMKDLVLISREFKFLLLSIGNT